MQATQEQRGRRRGGGNGRPKMDMSSLKRAIVYLRQYPKVTIGALGAMIIATLAQLAVPQLLQEILDTITSSAMNKLLLDLPAEVQTFAAEALNLDLTAAQTELNSAERAIIVAGLIIVAFAVARGLFSFAQTYLSQILSQNIAFELRLSEYHTGLRAYSRHLLETIPYHANSDDFVFDQELIAQVVAAGMRRRIGEIAVVNREDHARPCRPDGASGADAHRFVGLVGRSAQTGAGRHAHVDGAAR